MNLKHIEKTHTLQLDQSDCGVACLMSIIRLYQGNNTLEKIRELSGTTKQGTTMLGLYQAAIKLGFTAEGCEADIQALIDHKQPLLLHVLIENQLNHFIVCYEYDETKGFLIGDPGKGVFYMSITELEKIWVSKICLVLEPNKTFIKEKAEINAQRKWFLEILKEDYKLLWISILLGIFVAGLGMAMSLFSQKLIDDILPSQNIKKLISGIGLLTILLLARVGLAILREFFLLQQSKDFNNRINNQFFSSLLHLPKPFFDTRKIGELVARLNDTQRVQSVIKKLTSSFVIDVLVSIISLGFLFSYSWKLGLISLLSLPIYFYIIYRSNKKIINAQKEVMQSYAFNESNYINSIQGISTIKNDNKQEIFAKANNIIFANFQEKIFNLGKINITLSWQSGLASVLFLIGILIYASIQVFNNEMKLGELMAVLGITGSLLPSIANIALIAIPIYEAKIAFIRMHEFASIEKEEKEGFEISGIEQISIQNLSFHFAGRSELFNNVNIEIRKGKFIAIVGESGSGKSTVGQILQRFNTYEKGNIIINDQYELSEINLENYRNLIGVIPQEITIFNGNVVDNILLGSKSAPETLIDFIENYGFDVYFNQFPQGLATILGEEGINLSGGQKQIIALARVLYKKPQFLILDEATSAMDRNTENFTMTLFQKIKPNCAIFFISHRLNMLKNVADIIYILEDQTISISGNHQELIETDNFYSNYFKPQFI
ncbi:peptidase domain-containing ABC transporter [Flavobacterium circumlabens]|uniref:ATP-binding cassette subfamily B protein n=1 Tax=Flavobacterium circumlabens TaxID=2133765 RepID=A0A4Y7UIA8_9FLAO|nr:peptidase domain-containing ABC transporter [Flavobacterium circumlabens]TCN61070.1 ATP-binding cassette subfamily B protein [Flavobacterium circumlabens]TEB46183.1 peptidase domain-containing ABC transporter [Flavobacterium circumlabens]